MKLQRFATYLVAGIVLSAFSCERLTEVEELFAPTPQQSVDDCGSHYRTIQVSTDSILIESTVVGTDAVYDVYVVLPSGIDSVWAIDHLEISFEHALPSKIDIEIDLENSRVFDEDTDATHFEIAPDGHSLDLEIIPSTCDHKTGEGLWFQLVMHHWSLCLVSTPGGISIVVDDNL